MIPSSQHFLLAEQVEQLRDWFHKLYVNEGHTLDVVMRHDIHDRQEQYMIHLSPKNRPARSLPTVLPFKLLENLAFRVDVKKGALPRWKRAIMDELQ